ncbi:hypothetical protein [Huintestinicola sp.]|uniref:hypothetical protein n=1 Tax=Huintestinicola sp. TaxID=2981661 RepID=UPI003D7C4C44
MLAKDEFDKICSLDDIAEQAGGFVYYSDNCENSVHYDYRAIIAYCKENNIEPIDMTIREMQQFVIC